MATPLLGENGLGVIVDFLVLCQNNGLIVFNKPLQDIRAKLESLWNDFYPEHVPVPSEERHSSITLEGEQHLDSTHEDFEGSSIFDIKTPELISFPSACDQPVTVPSACDQLVTVPSACDQPVTAPSSCDQLVTVPSSCDQPVTAPSSCDQPVTAPSSCDQPVTAPSSCDQPVTAPSSCDQPVTAPSSCDQPVTAPSSCDQPVTAPSACDQPVTVPSSCDQPVTAPRSTEVASNSDLSLNDESCNDDDSLDSSKPESLLHGIDTASADLSLNVLGKDESSSACHEHKVDASWGVASSSMLQLSEEHSTYYDAHEEDASNFTMARSSEDWSQNNIPPFNLDISSEVDGVGESLSESHSGEAVDGVGEILLEPCSGRKQGVAVEEGVHSGSNEGTEVEDKAHLWDDGDNVGESELEEVVAVKKKGDVPSHPVVDSSDEEAGSDEEADEKLEILFSDLRIQSAKRHAPRKSLTVFIVSDSEEVDHESDAEDGHTQESTPCFTPFSLPSIKPSSSTPYTPYTSIVFWDSPASDTPAATHTTLPRRKPLQERNHVHTSGLKHNHTAHGTSQSYKPVTTPSATKNFSRFKTKMVRELFELFNSTVFGNKLPADMDIKWNNKLRTTAGHCCYTGFVTKRSARIELSNKVCDSYVRIRDTLIHELCHAAVWIIDGIKGGGHGSHWKAWAHKANTVHPDLETVSRCHSYEIAYKYTYKCTRCDFRIGRHSKSLNLKTAQCPYCLSFLELLPQLKADGTPAVVRVNKYAQFVKENYAAVKSQSPWRRHKEVMEKLSERYAVTKGQMLNGSFSD